MKGLRARLHYQWGMMLRFYGLRSRKVLAFKRAEQAFSRALILNPHFAQAQYDRGLLHWRELDNPQQAIFDFSAICDVLPDALFMRSMAYQSLQAYDAALTDLETFVNRYPQSEWASTAQSQIALLQSIISEAPPQLPNR